MSFARLSALWINIVKTSKISERLFKIQIFEADINNNKIKINKSSWNNGE